MANPIVRVVTPAGQRRENHKSIKAFQDELLNNLGWDGSVDYFVYWAEHNTANLNTAARQAVADAQAALNAGQPAVIVTSGLEATTKVFNRVVHQGDPVVPIIQGIGGDPGLPGPPTNVTGYTMDALGVAKHHLDNSPQDVTVLYDDTANSASLQIYTDLFNYNNSPMGPHKAITPVRAGTPALLRGLADLPAITTHGFMLIPSAMYFNHCDDIAAYVDGKLVGVNPVPVAIYYPEREYKKAHKVLTSVKVYGYNITLTYRQAAQYADKFLDGSMAIPLPVGLGLSEALKDQDPGA